MRTLLKPQKIDKSRLFLRFSQPFLAALTAIAFLIAPLAADSKPCVNCPKTGNAVDPYANVNGTANYDPAALSNSKLEASGQKLQAGTESTTLQVGTDSTTLQLGTQSTLLQANVHREGNPANVLFLVDSSQSMKESIPSGHGKGRDNKMLAAKQVLQTALDQIPPEVNLGLRVFGNGFRGDYSDCQQSTLLVPIGRNNRRSIIEAARQMAPYGLTPLTYGLMQAEQDLRYCQGPKTVILISDGAETCGGDPCAYVDRLSRIGVKMKIDIVGLGLRRDKEAKEQLNCIAEKSGGKYYDADTSADLIKSITDSVKQAVSGKVIMKMDEPASAGKPLPADFAPSGQKNKTEP